MRKLVLVSALLAATPFAAADTAEAGYVDALIAFDEAQEALDFDATMSFLPPAVAVSIETCDGTFEEFDRGELARLYQLVYDSAESITIERTVTGSKRSEDGGSFLIHSALTERAVLFDGAYDETTYSTDISRVSKSDTGYRIDSIKGRIDCSSDR